MLYEFRIEMTQMNKFENLNNQFASLETINLRV